MGKKGKTSRLKRKPAPRLWPIHRKEYVWVVKPSAGPHSLERCLPLSLVLRDVLGLATTRKEAKKIISQGKIHVDGQIKRKDTFPVGLMDVISIPELSKFYRLLPSHKGLFLSSISKEESSFKLVRVENKTVVKDGVAQISLHDGSNLRIRGDSENQAKVDYETFDTLKMELSGRQIIDRLGTKKGNMAIITGGKNMGKTGRIVEIEKTEAKKRRNALVVVEDEKGSRYQTILDFVFSIGGAQSFISLPEESTVV